jgi:hypothetical protein
MDQARDRRRGGLGMATRITPAIYDYLQRLIAAERRPCRRRP